jgi:hypothetical protein
LEVADIFRDHGPAWRKANAGHVSLDQLKVMSAIESCRTAALGGHVARCEDCAYASIAYNSCRNRHCPKCQGAAAKEWLADREADLLSVPYYHVVFTLPAAIAAIAYQNKAVIYGLLFKVSAETTLTIAADPKHLGARIGITSVLHSWGSALTHHPHVHMIVPGGGISLDGDVGWRAARLSSCRCAYSRACSGDYSWRSSSPPTKPAASASSATTYIWPMRNPSRLISRRCARPSGSSTQSARSADPRPCWLIFRATPTALPSPTVA